MYVGVLVYYIKCVCVKIHIYSIIYLFLYGVYIFISMILPSGSSECCIGSGTANVNTGPKAQVYKGSLQIVNLKFATS